MLTPTRVEVTRKGVRSGGSSQEKPVREVGLELRLYIAGSGRNSQIALENVRAICAEHFTDRYHLEVIDLLKDPTRAFADGIIVTPTLLRVGPLPLRRLIGTLEDREQAVLALRSG